MDDEPETVEMSMDAGTDWRAKLQADWDAGRGIHLDAGSYVDRPEPEDGPTWQEQVKAASDATWVAQATEAVNDAVRESMVSLHEQLAEQAAALPPAPDGYRWAYVYDKPDVEWGAIRVTLSSGARIVLVEDTP